MIDFSKQDEMDNRKVVEMLIKTFLNSPDRKRMIDGNAYYMADNPDIMHRKMFRFRENKATGEIERVPDRAKPNNRRAHAFMHLMVEDKVNYLLSKPYTLSCEKSDGFLEKVKDVLGNKFQEKRLMKLGVMASNSGIAWLHPYIDENGAFKTIVIPGEQCIPGWVDNDHEGLFEFIWFYTVEVIEDYQTKQLTKVEYWTPEGVAYYTSRTARLPQEAPDLDLILDAEKYLDVPEGEGDLTGHFTVNGLDSSWGEIPFIPFKNNDYELPDLQFVRTLINAYDKTRSDIANYLDEVKNIVYALKGYGGEDLGEFMRDLNYFRAISLDEDGSAETLTPTIDISAAKEDYDQLRKDIFTFGQAVDKDSDKLGNSPSGIALKFMYSGLDLKCNRMENAFKEGLEKLVWFVNRYLEVTGQGADYDAEIDITFNRDININESQAITDCLNSRDVISDETILENHPWVKDVDEELRRMKAQEREAEKTISSMFTDTNEDNEDEVLGEEAD